MCMVFYKLFKQRKVRDNAKHKQTKNKQLLDAELP